MNIHLRFDTEVHKESDLDANNSAKDYLVDAMGCKINSGAHNANNASKCK